MNHIRFYVALMAACILVMPALSMPNDEVGQDGRQKQCDCQDSMKDCKQMWQDQERTDKPCGCQEQRESMMGEDSKHMCQGQEGKDKNCGCQKSMMAGKQPMSCGEMDKQPAPCGDRPKMGADGNNGPHSMMGEDGKHMCQGQEGKDKDCGCQDSQKSMMGEDGKQMAHKHIKSMMGDKEKKGNGEVKIVIINVNA